MNRRNAGTAAAAAVVMLTAGVGAAAGAPSKHQAVAHTPKISVTISKHGFKVAGPRTFAAGRVALSLTAVGDERTLGVGSLKKGYTWSKLRADLLAFGTKAGTGPNGSTPAGALKHLNNVLKHTTLYGGLDAVPGQKEQATVVLPKAGTYVVFNDTGNLPMSPTKLTVKGPAVKRATPKSTATVTALTTRRFGGPATLPAHGTITFKNKSTESPHFLALIHVKEGTTRKDVLAAFMSNGPSPIFLNGQAGTDAVGEGLSQTLTYSVPKGEYVEVCFFPDPKTGMPHAFMGMIRVVHLT